MINILDRLTLGEGWLLRIDGDPTQGGGLDAPIGSYAQWDNGSVGKQYIKVGASAEAWQEMATHTYVLSVKSLVDQSIASESSRAQTAEASLQAAIEALDSGSSDALDAEISRAIAAEAALQSAVNAEQSRAQAAEGVLTSDLAAEVSRATAAESSLSSAVSAEQSRAMAAEGVLTAAVAAEQSRAMAAEGVLTAAVAAEQSRAEAAEADLAADLAAEQSRAEAAEADLAADLAAEQSRAMAAEDGLDGRLDILEADPVTKTYVDGEVSRIDNRIDNVISNIDPAALDSLTEIVDAFQNADGDINQAISNLANSASSDLAAEQSRAMAAEASLSSAISQEALDRAAAVSAEQSRAEAAEADLAADLAAEQSRAEAAEDALQAAVDQEALDRAAAVSTEQSRAQAAEASLSSAVSAEQSRAMAAESDLADAIDQEVADREAAVAAEQSRAEAAEGVLTAAVAAEQSAREAEDLTFLKLDGSRAMEDDLDMDGSKILNVADGVTATDAVNKGQLDAQVTRLDGRIDSVISNIDPAALDSLSEVVAAFQDADGNINQSITDLANSASSNLSAEQSRAMAAEDALQAAIDQEVLDRDDAISTEASIREAEDLTFLKLDGSRAMEADLNMEKVVQGTGIVSSWSVAPNMFGQLAATINFVPGIADGYIFTDDGAGINQALPPFGMVFSGMGGWAYNSGPYGITTLYHLPDVGGSPDFSQPTLIGTFDYSKSDSSAIVPAGASSAVMHKIVGLADGVDANDAVNKSQLDSINTAFLDALAQEAADREAAVSAEQSRAEAAESSLQTAIADETARAFAAESDISDALDQEVADREAAVAAEQSRAMAAEGVLTAAVAAEQSRAEAAEAALQDALDQEVADREAAVAAEQSRAMAAESDLADAIDQEVADREAAVAAEISRAEAAEAVLTSGLAAEISRAEAAEAALQDALDQEVADREAAVAAEQSRAMAAEAGLDGRLDVLEADPVTKTYVDGEVSRIDGRIDNVISNIDPAALDSLTEIVAAFQNADSNINDTISTLANTASSNLSAEQSRAMAAEAAIAADLAAEISRAQAAEAVLTSGLAVEISRATAAEADLADAIDQEVADREAAVSAEQSRAMAAEAVLTSGLAAEISRAQAAEASLSSAVSAEQSRAMAAEAAEQASRVAAVSAEQSRAMAAEAVLTSGLAAEISRAEAAEAVLTSGLAAEISRAQAAEAAEASTRATADTALSAKDDVIESRQKFLKTAIYNDFIPSYTGGQAGVEDPVTQGGYGLVRDGWYFKNSSAGQSIGWYYFDNVTAKTPNVTKANFNAYAVMTLDTVGTSGERPILAVYSYPTGSGDGAAGFFHSRWSYVLSQTQLNSLVAGKKYLFYIGSTSPNVHPELEHIQLGLSAGASVGPKLDSEVIGFAMLSSDTGYAVNKVQWLVESLGVESPTFKLEVEMRIRKALKSALDAEITARSSAVSAEQSRAMAAEASLSSAISSEAAARTAAVSAEQSRAMAAEAVLTSGLAAEISRAQAAEATEQAARIAAVSNEAARATAAEGSLSSALTSEISRAQAAEAVLTSGLAAEISRAEAAEADLAADLAAEQSRAMAAEDGLDGRLDILEGDQTVVGSVAKSLKDSKDYTDAKITDLVNSAPAVLDTLKELADALGDDPNFATTVANQIAAVSADITAEVSRAQAAEGSLQSALAAEISRATAAESVLTSNLSAEISRAEAAEVALDARLDVLETDPVTKTYVDGQISSVNSSIDDLDGYAQDIRGDLDQEILDREAADLTFVKTDGSRSMAKLDVTGDVSIVGTNSKFSIVAGSEFYIAQSAFSTSDATQTAIQSIVVPANSMVHVRTTIVARRTSGPGIGDGAVYVREARYKNVGGVVTVHTVQSTYTSEDIAGLDAGMDVSGSNAVVLVTGASSTSIDWECTTQVTILG